jgi:hypothetical protein
VAQLHQLILGPQLMCMKKVMLRFGASRWLRAWVYGIFALTGKGLYQPHSRWVVAASAQFRAGFSVGHMMLRNVTRRGGGGGDAIAKAQPWEG